jgi:hypothetical protein
MGTHPSYQPGPYQRPYQQPPKQSGGKSALPIILIIVGVILLLILLSIGGCVVGMFFFARTAVEEARGASQNAMSRNNLKQIGLAMHNYHDMHSQMPPAILQGADGTALHSWRTAILPMVGQNGIASRIDMGKPWNAPPNQQFNSTVVAVYHNPLDSSPLTDTSYVVIVDENAAFHPSKTRAFRDFDDGLSNTIMAIELKNSGINWMEPRDLTIDQAVAAIQGSGEVRINVLMVDGAILQVDRTTDAAKLRGMMTINGGELPF